MRDGMPKAVHEAITMATALRVLHVILIGSGSMPGSWCFSPLILRFMDSLLHLPFCPHSPTQVGTLVPDTHLARAVFLPLPKCLSPWSGPDHQARISLLSLISAARVLGNSCLPAEEFWLMASYQISLSLNLRDHLRRP